jgi:hypothetical protein
VEIGRAAEQGPQAGAGTQVTTPSLGALATGGAYSRLITTPGQRPFGYTSAGYLSYDGLPQQVGYLEMYTGGQSAGSCSATVVDTNMVLTAAHCVDEVDCFRFYPDLFGEQAAYGSWDSCRAFLPQSYRSPEAWRWVFDYALIVFPPNGRGSIGDVVGTQPVLMDTTGLSLPKYNVGYPGEGWFADRCTGERCFPWYCSAADPGSAGRIDWGNGYASMAHGCDLNGGISGGPIFGQYDGRWYVVSVNSTGGIVVPCSGPCASDRNSYYMQNMWGPGFRTGAFDTFWNEVRSLG